MVRKVYVASSNIDWVAYDDEAMELSVGFCKGHDAVYRDVPVAVWRGLLDAESKGRYLWETFRGKGV